MTNTISKVMVIGSGPIVIGQAAEFDYAGTQACKSLQEEGIRTVLVNSNPATIMTDEGIADAVYIEPLTVPILSRIIEKEKPDGLLPTLGGQTGLNLAVDLADAGVLSKYNVRLLGTPLETIKKAEERSLFKQLLLDIGEPIPESAAVHSVQEAVDFAEQVGLPLIVRPSYTLGGSGSGFAMTPDELMRMVANGLASSPSNEVLIEKSLLGWKEIEFEVMRDGANNCITICNMENIDPMGVHTGDSIVVAPSQTLTDKEYQMLRSASLRIIRALGVQGGCNVQFALTPSQLVADKWISGQAHGQQSSYYVIEVNPRVSRSSALASKATGYPIARIAAKIAIGKTLDEITNRVTGKTLAAFEPALDYCVVKIPRWPFDKFPLGDRHLGSQMKATGEVMAIDRCFEAALQKAVRSLEIGNKTLLWKDSKWDAGSLDTYPLHSNDMRLWALMSALRNGFDCELLSEKMGIDPWFMYKFKSIIDMEKRLLSEKLTHSLLLQAKRMGFSDDYISTLSDRLPEQVRQLRKEWNIKPVFKMVDTCAAEFEAQTPYYYSTYDEENEAVPMEGNKVVVIGSGPIRIGQGIEFDYCSVHSAWALQEAGVQSILVNSNPETVSTDFDTSDRLYFDPLDEESMRDILENEAGDTETPDVATIIQFGGQTAINLAEPLNLHNMPILGTSAHTTDVFEDRRGFEKLMDSLGISQPPGSAVTAVKEGIEVAKLLEYPVLVRPSYVLGGRGMEIVYGENELIHYLSLAIELDSKHPVLIDKYLEGKEVEVDAVCDGKNVFIPGIMEHIERAGVHSGDSIAVYPAISLNEREKRIITDYTTRLGTSTGVLGLMNIQFIIMPGNGGEESAIYVLEVNPRASRTIPFISKVTGVPMINVATRVMLGESLEEQGYEPGLMREQPFYAVKVPVFSATQMVGVDTYVGPEMKSTGEVMGIDVNYENALIKGLMGAGLSMSSESSLLFSIANKHKEEALPIIAGFYKLGYTLYATEGTANFIKSHGMKVMSVGKYSNLEHPDSVDIINSGMVGGVFNTVNGGKTSLKDGFEIRRAAADKHIPCITSLDTAKALLTSLRNSGTTQRVQPMHEYVSSRSKIKTK